MHFLHKIFINKIIVNYELILLLFFYLSTIFRQCLCGGAAATYGSGALFGAAIGAGLGAAIATGSVSILCVCAYMTYRHYSQCSREYRSQRDEMLEQNKKAKDLLSPRSSLIGNIGNIEANPLESKDLQLQPNYLH